MADTINKPDYLFEVSWEICNKIGGIHTVIATKVPALKEEYGKRHVLIGPDVWMETEQNPEFTEDPVLLRTWRKQAAAEGLRVRVGHWNIPGNPVAILVDFTPFIAEKDNILTEFWKRFEVDSLKGQWDYIESALFGYVAGKVIESYIKFELQPYHKVAAQFHEWMSGAGLLYLKQQNLSVATVFTTHATVVGRCLACNNMPLYDSLSLYDGDEKARQFNISSRHSLEKMTAKYADVFTTVSSITAAECRQFLKRNPDIITPNGFDRHIVPDASRYGETRKQARKSLLAVASAMHGTEYPEDTVLIAVSGRYEFRNKGIDVFLDAVGKMKNDRYSGKEVLAYIMIPAGNNGPDKELVSKLKGDESAVGYTARTTHLLSEPEYDAVLGKMNVYGFNGRADAADKIQVVYVPSYLNGNDGIFNMAYYDLLIGFDLTVFPSYYEPWGYTPLESLAFRVPTATTSLAGFGSWIEEHCAGAHPGIEVIVRNDSNYDAVVEAVAARISEIASLDVSGRERYGADAEKLSRSSEWKENLAYYREAYAKALAKIVQQKGAFPGYKSESEQAFRQFRAGRPAWAGLMIHKRLPDRLKHLDTLSRNLWWCWNQEATDLFREADGDLWSLSSGNPIAMLDMIGLKRYKALAEDDAFIEKLDTVYGHFREYMSRKQKGSGPKISYFCMEYGLDASLKIYSGGLGILAGDYLKEASDMNVNMNAVGFLYKYGYFSQQLSSQGDQVATYEPQDFTRTPASPVLDENGNWVMISVAFPGRNVYARVWKVEVGRVDLYLLDTDFENNLPEDRSISHQLYGGDWENRLKQELILGVGGIRVLRALGIHSDVYHCNEGHAAFIGLERLREYVQVRNLSYGEALEVVRSSSLFTTHTPVPAGHDAFSEDLLRKYIAHYPGRFKIDWTTLMALGRKDPYNSGEKFSMSNLAANLSQEVNGVSWLHGKVSQYILADLWPGYLPEELHVGYVTNGVHYPTWTAPEWKEVHAKVFGEAFASHHYDKDCFEGIYEVSSEEIWHVRKLLKKRLISRVKEIISDPISSSHYAPHHVVKINGTLRDDVLTIGFARRFATYKRASLLFRNLERLNQIVNHPERPVQFLFAGKAHPADKAGQDLIKQIVEISKMPQFIGKIVFIPNYDISIAKSLVQGVDVWMNTPTRPLEASGTSGEKAVMNGVMHFSVLDGWWVEGYKEGAGWALRKEQTYEDPEFQNELDAATIYDIIETEIVPKYYDKKAEGYSESWIETIRNCVAKVACDYTTNRMMTDYLNKYYLPLARRHDRIAADDYRKAREIAFWKKRMRRDWPMIEVLSSTSPSSLSGSLLLGKEYTAEITLSIGEIDPMDIGAELLLAEQNKDGRYSLKEIFEYRLKEYKDGIATYVCRIVPDKTGAYQIAGRIFAKKDFLPHRQDFELVKWL